MLCIRCHREIPDGSAFCNLCGKRQAGQAPPPHRRSRRRQKGSGTVYKLSGRRSRPWCAVSGGGVLLGTFEDSGSAVNALDAYNASRVPADRRAYTLADIYAMWSPNHYRTISASGRASYELAYTKAAPLHQRRIMELKTEDYQTIIDALVQQGKSRSLCEKQRQLFSQLCQYAMQQDIIDKNYATFLVMPASSAPKTRVLSEKEVEAITSMTGDKRLGETAKIALVLCYTGMRINELLTLKTADVHLEARYVVGGEKTAAGRNRPIPLSEEILPYMKEWMDGNTGEYLLHTAAGLPRDHNNVRKSFNSLMKRLGIEGVTPHTCRHTAATRWVEQGLPPEIIKQILGHASFATTADRYTHTDVTALVAAIDKNGPGRGIRACALGGNAVSYGCDKTG